MKSSYKRYWVLILWLVLTSTAADAQKRTETEPSCVLRIATSKAHQPTRFTISTVGSGLNIEGRMNLEDGVITVTTPIELTIESGLTGLTLRKMKGYPDLHVEVELGQDGVPVSSVAEYQGSTFTMKREAEGGEPTFEAY